MLLLVSRMKCVCSLSKNALVHSRHYQEADAHDFMDPRKPGLKPMSERMAEFREASGYNAAVKAARGKPCAVGFDGCMGIAQHLHEPLSRAQAGGLKAALRDGPPPLPCCDYCNEAIEQTVNGRAWALAHGFKVKRKEAIDDSGIGGAADKGAGEGAHGAHP